MTEMTDYDVVVLIEEALTPDDGARLRSLHEAIEEPVAYHLLLPVDDAAAQIEASLGTIGPGGGDAFAAPAMQLSGADLAAVREGSRERAQTALTESVAALEQAGATVASSETITGSPVDALTTKIAGVEGREAIVMTRPHVVAEFFHLDWTSRARRQLGVPVLHLLEHETFDEQAYGE